MPHDEAATVLFVSFDDLRINTETLGQGKCLGLFGNEGVRPTFDEEFCAMFSLNCTAEPRTCFEECQSYLCVLLSRELNHTMTGGKSSNSTTDDCNAFHHRYCPPNLKVRRTFKNNSQPDTHHELG